MVKWQNYLIGSLSGQRRQVEVKVNVPVVTVGTGGGQIPERHCFACDQPTVEGRDTVENLVRLDTAIFVSLIQFKSRSRHTSENVARLMEAAMHFRLSATGIRALVVAAMLLGPSGCLISPVPAFPPGTGDDVGAVLEFRHYDAPNDGEPQPTERYVRKAGNVYSIEGSDRVDILRFGTRGSEPVYLVQVNANNSGSGETDAQYLAHSQFLYAVFLVAVTADGEGANELMSCTDPAIRSLAKMHGLSLNCFPDMSGYVGQILNLPAEGALLGFLRDVLASGSLRWEDQEGVNILGLFRD
jgi:hypothetical protein